jgi:hypothetical protein
MARKQSNTEGSHTIPPYVPVPVELMLDPELASVDVRVWSYIRWRQGRNSSAWPCKDRIAEELHISIDTVKRSIFRLSKRCWIEIERPNRTGRGAKCHYTAKTVQKKGCKISPFLSRKVVQNSLKKGCKIYPLTNNNELNISGNAASAFTGAGGVPVNGRDAPTPREVFEAQLELRKQNRRLERSTKHGSDIG